MRTSLVAFFLFVVACSKSSSDQKTGSAGPASLGSSGSSAPAPAAGAGSEKEPVEAAPVVGPTRSVSGVLELSGLITGKFEWIKKDQTTPISCAWSPEKEIGALRVDLSNGAGKLVKVTLDVPPIEAGSPKLEVTSKDLPTPLKTSLGFNLSGDEPGQYQVKFIDTTFTESDKPDAKPTLTIKGTLEVNCAPKK
jgi:hypothetical protein